MGFTHVEFLPIMEHPFYGSWGYQTTGYFAPTSRYGTPQDFMYLIDYLHQHGIGVILDWVPSHFPTDEPRARLLRRHPPLRARRPAPGLPSRLEARYIFNYGRHEVRSFLLSSAMFWLDKYHVDGLRVDAVASMLYLDYSRKARRVDSEQVRRHARTSRPSTSCAASTRKRLQAASRTCRPTPRNRPSWPMVSRPTYVGGLGFGYQVGHGLDARHAALLASTTRSIASITTTI